MQKRESGSLRVTRRAAGEITEMWNLFVRGVTGGGLVQAMGMVLSREEDNGIRNPVNRGVVVTKPGFSHDELPTGEFSDLEG